MNPLSVDPRGQPSHAEAVDFTDGTGDSTVRAQRHRQRRALVAACMLFVGIGVGGFAPERPEVIRARGVVIVRSLGRERIALGAPMPDGRDYVGLTILNASVAEQS